MSEPSHTAFCPQCQKDVPFIHRGQKIICQACGFYYLAQPAQPDGENEGERFGGRSILKSIAYVILIMIGIVVVGVAVLFAGCALMLGHSL